MAIQTTRIHLIRHGEVHNPRKVLYGRLPRFRLTTNGRCQAQAAGRVLSNQRIDALYSSPLLRARQTAREILSSINQSTLHISSLLNEVCTAYEGQPGAQIDARDGDIYTGAAACFEQPQDVVARTRRFIWRMRRRYTGGCVAAVTHGDVITFMVLWAKGLAPTPKNKTGLLKAGYPVSYPSHASISTLTYLTDASEERPEIDFVSP